MKQIIELDMFKDKYDILIAEANWFIVLSIMTDFGVFVPVCWYSNWVHRKWLYIYTKKKKKKHS